MKISLHHLTLQDVQPDEFADIAAETGYNSVCLFIKVPGDAVPFPRIQSVAAAQNFKKRLDGLGLSVHNTDTFMITPDAKPSDHAETLDIAAALGAKTFNALSLDPDKAVVAEKLATVAEMAGKVGIQLILEWFRFSEIKTLKDSVDLLKRAGDANLALNVDILHLIRNGETPDDMANVDPALMGYAQVSDGPLSQPDDEKQLDEATMNRNFPGAEEYPLISFIQRLPKDTVVCVEAPVARFAANMSAKERAQRNIDGTRKVLAAAGR